MDAKEIERVSAAKRSISETNALAMLDSIRDRFRARLAVYEVVAKSCATCDTRGACCVDAHFVNVRISRLEAVAIRRSIAELSEPLRSSVRQRIDEAIERFGLSESDGQATFACPLFDRDRGCLVHDTAKPLPCIHHACYERREDLPPDELLDEAELKVGELNRKVYGRRLAAMSLPVAIRKLERA